MTATENAADLWAALSAAQAQADDAKLDSTNPAFKSRYASLASVLGAVRSVLGANGLALAMSPVCEDGRAGVDWVLGHKSGQSMTGSVRFRLAQDTPQGAGSAITYARRYTVSALLGIAADDDDDGNAGSSPRDNAPRRPLNATETRDGRSDASRPAKPEPPAVRPSGEAASNAQKSAVFAAITALGVDAENRTARLAWANGVLGQWSGSFARMSSTEASRLIDAAQVLRPSDAADLWAAHTAPAPGEEPDPFGA